jgi:FkbM family methyltransferase
MTVALSYYVIRDARQEFRTPAALNVNVPCEEHSIGYRKYQTPIGIICAERDVHDVIKRTLIEGKLWEPDVVELLDRLVRPDSVVIDVGAHMGSHTLTMARRVGPKGMVVAFEPQTKLYEELLGNLALNAINNVRAEFVALGDAPALITMGVAIDVSEGITAVGQGGNMSRERPVVIIEINASNLVAVRRFFEDLGYDLRALVGANYLAQPRPQSEATGP